MLILNLNYLPPWLNAKWKQINIIVLMSTLWETLYEMFWQRTNFLLMNTISWRQGKLDLCKLLRKLIPMHIGCNCLAMSIRMMCSMSSTWFLLLATILQLMTWFLIRGRIFFIMRRVMQFKWWFYLKFKLVHFAQGSTGLTWPSCDDVWLKSRNFILLRVKFAIIFHCLLVFLIV